MSTALAISAQSAFSLPKARHLTAGILLSMLIAPEAKISAGATENAAGS